MKCPLLQFRHNCKTNQNHQPDSLTLYFSAVTSNFCARVKKFYVGKRSPLLREREREGKKGAWILATSVAMQSVLYILCNGRIQVLTLIVGKEKREVVV